MPGDKTIIRTTCPRDCYDSCGIAVIKRRGVITKGSVAWTVFTSAGWIWQDNSSIDFQHFDTGSACVISIVLFVIAMAFTTVLLRRGAGFIAGED